MYFAAIRQVNPRPFTPEEIDAYIEQAGDDLPEGFEPATLTTFEYVFEAKGPFKKYKLAFREVTPMLDALVPHEGNRGLVLSRHPDSLPMEKLDLPVKPKKGKHEAPPGGWRPRLLNQHVLRIFWPRPQDVALLRDVELKTSMGQEPPAKPDDVNDAPYLAAIARGEERRAAAPPAPSIRLPKAPADLGRDGARAVASLLEIPGRGRMKANELRDSIGGALRIRGYVVDVVEGAEPEILVPASA